MYIDTYRSELKSFWIEAHWTDEFAFNKYGIELK